MKRRLNKRNLITAIIIGEIMVLIIGIIGFQNMEDTTILLILFPFGMIALTVIVWFQIYISEKIKDDAVKRCNVKTK